MLSPREEFSVQGGNFCHLNPVPMKSSELEFDTDIPAPTRAVRTSSRHRACTAKDTGKPWKQILLKGMDCSTPHPLGIAKWPGRAQSWHQLASEDSSKTGWKQVNFPSGFKENGDIKYTLQEVLQVPGKKAGFSERAFKAKGYSEMARPGVCYKGMEC